MRIFISYSHRDSDFASKVCDIIQAWGYETWIDKEDIPSGDNLVKSLEGGLRKSDVIVSIMTPNSIKSDYIKAEWIWAVRHNRPLIPILAKKTDILDFPFTDRTLIDCTRDEQMGLNQLKNALAHYTPSGGRVRSLDIEPSFTFLLQERNADKIIQNQGHLNLRLIIKIYNAFTTAFVSFLMTLRFGKTPNYRAEKASSIIIEHAKPATLRALLAATYRDEKDTLSSVDNIIIEHAKPATLRALLAATHRHEKDDIGSSPE